MSYSYLEERLAGYLQDAIELGCIVKYNPSLNLTTSDWMFTHFSLQEYFLAYHLGSCSEENNEITDYIKQCSTIGRLQKLKVVLSFLCGINSDRANKVLQPGVKTITGETECWSLMSYLKELIPFYRSISHVDIPLPQVTDVTTQDLNRFQCLFSSDNKEHNRNLQHSSSMTLAILSKGKI